jgi:methionine-rich copper-binding protein CopC
MTPRLACRAAALFLALGAMLALDVPSAQAAAVPVATTPSRYAALMRAPRVIRLRFSEAIVEKSSSVELTDLAGQQVRVTRVKIRGDRTLEVRINGKLDAGVYMVHWTAVSAVDGSKATGRYQFTVQ